MAALSGARSATSLDALIDQVASRLGYSKVKDEQREVIRAFVRRVSLPSNGIRQVLVPYAVTSHAFWLVG